MLTDAQCAAYRRDGYLVVPGLLDPATLARARAALDAMLAGAAGRQTHDAVYDLEPGHRPDAPRVRRIKTPHVNHPCFAELAALPALLDALRRLLGPSGVRLHGSKINLKSPYYGSPVEWHQDWAFYPHTNDDILAVGVMLDDATEANGPLLVLPGSHTGPVFDHHAEGYFCGAMDLARDGVDVGRAVPLLGPAGSVSFHHVRLVHGSAQNTSDRPRALLLYEYAAADAWPLLGVRDLAAFGALLLDGAPGIVPRLAPVPVRMPLPPALRQGSIYENQTTAARRFFAVREPA
jgi:ectoine hydroxylase-related dioxygenase (phytanoyl-CoA dioxygenase family)